MTMETQKSPNEAIESEPQRIAAASVLMFRGDAVLLVKRNRGAMAGLWSAPGGHVEAGETAVAAATRELKEETGLVAAVLVPLTTHVVMIDAAHGLPARIYEIAVFAGAAEPEGEPRASGDAIEARFQSPADLSKLKKTPGLDDLIAAAHRVTVSL